MEFVLTNVPLVIQQIQEDNVVNVILHAHNAIKHQQNVRLAD